MKEFRRRIDVIVSCRHDILCDGSHTKQYNMREMRTDHQYNETPTSRRLHIDFLTYFVYGIPLRCMFYVRIQCIFTIYQVVIGWSTNTVGERLITANEARILLIDSILFSSFFCKKKKYVKRLTRILIFFCLIIGFIAKKLSQRNLSTAPDLGGKRGCLPRAPNPYWRKNKIKLVLLRS